PTDNSGGNYYVTLYSYDDLGQQNRIISPNGTITRTVYDLLGRQTSTWIGTNDAPYTFDDVTTYWSPGDTTNPAWDLVEISATVYDNGGVGDGNVTATVAFPDNYTGDVGGFQVTQMYYDWRDRLVATKSGALVEYDASIPEDHSG